MASNLVLWSRKMTANFLATPSSPCSTGPAEKPLGPSWQAEGSIWAGVDRPPCLEMEFTSPGIHTSILYIQYKKAELGCLTHVQPATHRDITKAKRYGKVILRLQVFTGKVKVIRRGNFDSDRLTWRQQGYDCAWVPAFAGIP